MTRHLMFSGETADGEQVTVRPVGESGDLELRIGDSDWMFVGPEDELNLHTRIGERDHLTARVRGIEIDARGSLRT